jgi:uncharacterized protein
VSLPRRLRRLPLADVAELDGREIRVARDPLARLLGLAGLRGLPAHAGLLLPRTRSIHTLAMRFALDLVWLDANGRVVRIDRAVPPWRLRGCRAARAVVELPADTDA